MRKRKREKRKKSRAGVGVGAGGGERRQATSSRNWGGKEGEKAEGTEGQ